MTLEVYTLSCEDAIAFVCEAAWGFGEISKDGKFLWVNDAYCKSLGAPLDLIRGTHFTEWTHPDHIEIDRVLSERVAKGEIPGYTLPKAYRRFGYPPNKPDYAWGILSVQGKWSKTGEFLGYRVQFRESNIAPETTFVKWKELAEWTVTHWKTLLAILVTSMSLIYGGSGKLLDTLKKAKDTAESVDSALQPSSSGASSLQP